MSDSIIEDLGWVAEEIESMVSMSAVYKGEVGVGSDPVPVNHFLLATYLRKAINKLSNQSGV